MEDCMKSCKRMAAKTQETTESSSSSISSSKRSKISLSPEIEFLPPLFHIERRCLFPNISPPVSSAAGDSLASRCSSNESLDIVKDSFGFVDLETKSETDVSTCINSNNFSRETTPSSELRAEPEEMDTPAKNGTHPRKSKAPPQAEIEEFFSAAEKYEQERFAEKYNYDIVKDVPVEGRYQWVRLKP